MMRWHRHAPVLQLPAWIWRHRSPVRRQALPRLLVLDIVVLGCDESIPLRNCTDLVQTLVYDSDYYRGVRFLVVVEPPDDTVCSPTGC